MQIIQTDKAPKAIGPYAQAVHVNNTTLYCSGQIGLDPITGNLKDGIAEQTKQVMKNIKAVLIAGGCNFDSITKTTIFLTDMNDFAKVNDIYGSFFSDYAPARSTVGVAALPKGALVEIDVIAEK